MPRVRDFVILFAIFLALRPSSSQFFGGGGPDGGEGPFGGLFGSIDGGGFNPFGPFQPGPTPLASSPANERIVQHLKVPLETEFVNETPQFSVSIKFDLEKVHTEHHTDLYRGPDDTPETVDKLIVRRGYPFMVRVQAAEIAEDGVEVDFDPQRVLGLR